jgi:hypothetical protein
MKSEFTFFSKQAVLAFLADQGEERTKDYEFAAALVICRLCERRWMKDCWIGIRIKQKYSKALPAYNSQREITLAEVAKFLREGNDEDSAVDFVIAKMANMQKAKGMVFQVKRFGIGRNKKDTNQLIECVNSLKYAKTDANLLICLDDEVNVDLKKFYSKFDDAKFPFNRLLFLWVSTDSVFLRDVHPKGETERFLLSEIYSRYSKQSNQV